MCRHAQDTLLLIACADRKEGRGHRHVLQTRLLHSSNVLAPMTDNMPDAFHNYMCRRPFSRYLPAAPCHKSSLGESLSAAQMVRRMWKGCIIVANLAPLCRGKCFRMFSSTRRYTDGGAQWEAPDAAREGGHHAEGVRSRKFWGKRLSSRDSFGMWNLIRTAAYACCGLSRTFATQDVQMTPGTDDMRCIFKYGCQCTAGCCHKLQ